MKATPTLVDCPVCGSAEGAGITIIDISPEVLFWLCKICHATWPRFFDDEYLTKLAEEQAQKWARGN